MASQYTQGITVADAAIIRTAISILNRALGPYRDDVIVHRKLFGFLSVEMTVGQVLDWLTSTFGPLDPPAA